MAVRGELPAGASPRAAPGRRAVLRTAVLAVPLAAAGCKGVGALGTPPTPLPDVAVLQHAISGEELMIARYQAVLRAAPPLAGALRPLLGEHRAHLARLRARVVPGAGTPSPAATARPPPAVPASRAGATGYLRAAEDRAAAALTGRLGAASPSLAQLLASIAASEATHAAALARRGTG